MPCKIVVTWQACLELAQGQILGVAVIQWKIDVLRVECRRVHRCAFLTVDADSRSRDIVVAVVMMRTRRHLRCTLLCTGASIRLEVLNSETCRNASGTSITCL